MYVFIKSVFAVHVSGMAMKLLLMNQIAAIFSVDQ